MDLQWEDELIFVSTLQEQFQMCSVDLFYIWGIIIITAHLEFLTA